MTAVYGCGVMFPERMMHMILSGIGRTWESRRSVIVVALTAVSHIIPLLFPCMFLGYTAQQSVVCSHLFAPTNTQQEAPNQSAPLHLSDMRTRALCAPALLLLLLASLVLLGSMTAAGGSSPSVGPRWGMVVSVHACKWARQLQGACTAHSAGPVGS